MKTVSSSILAWHSILIAQSFSKEACQTFPRWLWSYLSTPFEPPWPFPKPCPSSVFPEPCLSPGCIFLFQRKLFADLVALLGKACPCQQQVYKHSLYLMVAFASPFSFKVFLMFFLTANMESCFLDILAWGCTLKALSTTFPAWEMWCPMRQFQNVWKIFMVTNHSPQHGLEAWRGQGLAFEFFQATLQRVIIRIQRGFSKTSKLQTTHFQIRSEVSGRWQPLAPACGSARSSCCWAKYPKKKPKENPCSGAQRQPHAKTKGLCMTPILFPKAQDGHSVDHHQWLRHRPKTLPADLFQDGTSVQKVCESNFGCQLGFPFWPRSMPDSFSSSQPLSLLRL